MKIRVFSDFFEDMDAWEVMEEASRDSVVMANELGLHNDEDAEALAKLIADKRELDRQMDGLAAPLREKLDKLTSQHAEQVAKLTEEAKRLFPNANWQE